MAVNLSSFWTQFAKQTSGKGVPAAAPAFYGKTTEAGLIPSREVRTKNVGDGVRWGTSLTYVQRIGAEGSPVFIAQPLIVGALLEAVLGQDVKSGGGDPYTHTITPADTASWFTFWQKLDTKYEKFPDCKVLELLIEGNCEDGFLYLTPTLGFAARPSSVSAPVDASAETLTYQWSQAKGYWVVDGDYTNVVTTAQATDLTTATALANALKTAYQAHRVLVVAPHHSGADSTNTIAAANGTDQATTITLTNELKAKLNLHRVQASVHYDNDTLNVVSSADATDLATLMLLVNEIRADYLLHIGAIGAIKNFSIRISRGANPWQGQDLVYYDFPEGRATVEATFGILVEDWGRYNKLYYGAKAPAAGTEVTATVYNGSFYVNFVLQAATPGPEKSLSLTIPTLRYTDNSMALSPNADGAAPEAALAGQASGTAPIITAVVKNERATAY